MLDSLVFTIKMLEMNLGIPEGKPQVIVQIGVIPTHSRNLRAKRQQKVLVPSRFRSGPG